MKKFLVSVADVFAYDNSDNLLFVGKTLLDSSIETTISNADVRAGRGNQLQYVYFHTAELKAKITEAQWNLSFLALNVGEDVVTGANVWKEETITLDVSKGGSVTDTPLAVSGSTVYGWVTLPSGTVERVTFSAKAFVTSGGAEGDKVCVRYFALNAAAKSLTIPADVVPSIVRLVMEAALGSSDSADNIIGKVQIEIPKAQLTGAFSIAMKADGVASTPLEVRALADDVLSGCTNTPTYAQVREIVNDTNWYDDVVALAIVGGDFSLPNGQTKQLAVRAIPSTGAAFTPPAADLTWASSDAAKASVSNGLVTWVAAGTATIKVSITAKATVDANVVATTAA